MNSAERIAEIRAREAKATTGPWASFHHGGKTGSDYQAHAFLAGPLRVAVDHAVSFGRSDADFIAHARTDIPWLLEQLATLRTIVNAGLASQAAWAKYMHCSSFDRDKFTETYTGALAAQTEHMRLLSEFGKAQQPGEQQ